MTTLESQPYCRSALAAIDAMLDKHHDKQPAALKRVKLSQSEVARLTRKMKPITERWAVV